MKTKILKISYKALVIWTSLFPLLTATLASFYSVYINLRVFALTILRHRRLFHKFSVWLSSSHPSGPLPYQSSVTTLYLIANYSHSHMSTLCFLTLTFFSLEHLSSLLCFVHNELPEQCQVCSRCSINTGEMNGWMKMIIVGNREMKQLSFFSL